jgi:protein PsiE
MVAIYFRTMMLPVRCLLYIAMTALGRVLIEMGARNTRPGKSSSLWREQFRFSFSVLVLRFTSPKDNLISS